MPKKTSGKVRWGQTNTPAIWQVALQVSKLTQQVGLLVTELSDSGTELREILRSSK
jgi:hypothetical protein